MDRTTVPVAMLRLFILCACLVQPAPAQPANPASDSLLVAGRAALRVNDFVAAESLLVRAVAIDAENAGVYAALADLYLLRDGDVDLAERAVAGAQSENPQSTAVLEGELEVLIRGRGATFRGDSEMLSLARSILQSESGSGVAHHASALVYERRYRRLADLQAMRPNRILRRQTERNLGRSQFHFDAALRNDPRRAILYDDLIRFAIKSRLFDDVSEIAETMRAFVPDAQQTLLYSAVAALYEDDPATAAEYFQTAMQGLSESELADYLQLDLILNDNERAMVRQDSAKFWSTYWQKRRPRYLSAENERLLSHYERIVLADLLYPGWRDRPNDDWIITPANILIRYGLPMAHRSWIDPADQMTRQLTLSYRHHTYIFSDWLRNGQYVIPSSAFAPEPGKSDPITVARGIIVALPETYGPPATIRDIGIVFESAQLRGATQSELYVVSGIPVTPADSSATMSSVVASAGLFAVDANGAVVESTRKSYYGMVPAAYVSTPAGELWCATMTVPLPADTREVSAEFELPGRDAYGAAHRELQPRSFNSGSLEVSDLIAAFLVSDEPSAGNPCAFERNGLAIVPTPTHNVYRDVPLYVYFEVYNLRLDAAGGSSYSVEVAVAPQQEEGGLLRRAWNELLNRAGDGGVSTRSVYEGRVADTGEYVSLDMIELDPGAYTIGIRVVDLHTGEVTEAQKQVNVVG